MNIKEGHPLLSTTLTFPENVNLAKLDLPFIKQVTDRHFQIFLDSADKSLADITMNNTVVTIEYSSELLLEEYIIIHNIISKIQAENSAVIDDTNSFLGYLASGEAAYIITNWDPWINHLNNSMKNCL